MTLEHQQSPRSRWGRLGAAAAAVTVLAVPALMAAPAAAQTPSPPGFGGCTGFIRSGYEYRDRPAVANLYGPTPWVALRGTNDRYIDKIVEIENRYEHIRYDARWDTYGRIGCKPKPPQEKPEDKPRFEGGGGGGVGHMPSFDVAITGVTFFYSGGSIRTGTVRVGEPTPYYTQQQ